MKNLPLCKHFVYKHLSIAVSFALFSTCQIATANDEKSENEPSATLDTIVIHSTNSDTPSITSTPMTDKTTSKKITEQLIMDNRDLVRYNPEVTIGEVGRYGSKGYAIQGVDGNRVAMLIDDVRVPDSEANEFYVPYGYVNDSRFMSDVETLQSVEIKKGADSLDSGNGAIGGAISYRTREPEDLIKTGEQLGGYLKTGFTNKNEEFMNAVGLAIKKNNFSGLVNYVYREGHELKNHEMLAHDKAQMNPYYFTENPNYTPFIDGWVSREYPDPAHYEQHASIAKLYYQPNDSHKFGIHGSYQYLLNHNNATSKGTTPGQNRVGYDENERTAYGANYEYFATNSRWLNNVKFSYTNQQIVTVGDTYKYPGSTKELRLNDREYRPNYFDTEQYLLEISTLPLSSHRFPWLGEHSFKAMIKYAIDDYDPYSVYWVSGYIAPDRPCRFDKEPYMCLDTSTMQIRTQTKSTAFSLSDKIYLNPKLSLNAGIRYDNYERTPTMHNWQKQHFEELSNQGINTGAVQAYRSGELTVNRKKDTTTWQAGLQFSPFERLVIDYQASTGFLMPLVTQMYAGFAMNGIEQIPNGNLKPEESFNQQLSIQKQWDNGYVKLTGYHNNYDNFITSANVTCRPSYECYQYINIEKAKSEGIALSTSYQLIPNWQYGHITINGQIAYQTGEQSNGESLLSIQPLNGLLGFTYRPNSDRYSITALGRFWGAKKAEDTLRYQTDIHGNTTLSPLRIRKTQNGSETQNISQFMKDTWTFDIFGNVKLSKGLSLQAGIYNLTDEKYLPWENIRPFASVGINQMIAGNGINRYTAPGRNYALSLNYEF